MAKYVTPNYYQRCVDDMLGVSSLPPMVLASLIARAESAVDSFVGFDLQGCAGFAPGPATFMQQGFDFTTRKIRIPTPIVPVRSVDRIRIHISNSGGGGGNNGLYATLSPSEVVINNWEGYMEIIALTLTYSMSAVLWEIGLNPPLVEIDLTQGYWIPYLKEPLYDTGDHLTYAALHQFWASSYTQAIAEQPNTLPPVPPVIYVNGSPVSNTTYTINSTEGTVTFNGSQQGNTITADLTAQIPDLVRDAAIEQTTYLLQQRALSRMGMGGLELVRNGQQQVRRSKSDDAEEDQLCAKARLKLAGYVPVAIA